MYICPMHPEVRSEVAGKCPKCGMALVLEGERVPLSGRSVKDFLPLIIIFICVFALTGMRIAQSGEWSAMFAMRNFEGFFFLIFGLFKLLNWKGFVDAYATYDIIAKRSRSYGYAYPLIELALAVGYLMSFHLIIVAWVTLILMSIGSIGVFREIRKKNQIPCACLGVVFKIPMTWVTFIEDVVMALMALIMIIWFL